MVDPANRERIAKLLRFASSRSDDPTARVSFDEYIARMPAGQTRIYYLGGPDLRLDRQEPQPRDLPPPRAGSPVPDRSDRRIRRQLAGVVPGQAPDLDRLGRPRSSRDRASRPSRPEPPAVSSATESGFARVLDLFRAALGQSGQRGARVEAPDRQPLLPGQRRRGHEHPDAAALEDGQQRVHREARGSSRSIRRRP